MIRLLVLFLGSFWGLLASYSASADTLQCWDAKTRGDGDVLFVAKIVSDNRIADIRFKAPTPALPDVPGELLGRRVTNRQDPYFGYNEYVGRFWLVLPEKLSMDILARAARIGTTYGKNQNGLLVYSSGKEYKAYRLICFTDAIPENFKFLQQLMQGENLW